MPAGGTLTFAHIASRASAKSITSDYDKVLAEDARSEIKRPAV
jgi:hypothetical protein